MFQTGKKFDNTKPLQINPNNKRENMLRNNHQYKVGVKILVKR